MVIPLKYGERKIDLSLDEKNILSVIRSREKPGLAQPMLEVKKALENPIDSGPLREILKGKKAKSLAVIVNDVTRPTPYNVMLPPLLEEAAAAGLQPPQVTFVVACGLHRAHTDEENRKIFGADVVQKYRFVSHDATKDLATIKKLSTGNELKINRIVAEADAIVATGLIQFHITAGFSGGRKSILPGVVQAELVRLNHAALTGTDVGFGRIEGNPMHAEMAEAARLVGVDFILNVVTNSKKEVVEVVAGDLEKAWMKGVKTCEQMFRVPIPGLADVVITSAGGFPKDINLYQAHKPIDASSQALKDGGTAVVLAECREGTGDAVFESWMKDAECLDDIFHRIEQRFVMGGHKAYGIAKILKRVEVILVSCLEKKDVEKMFFTYAKDLTEAMAMVRKKHGENFKALIIPEGGYVLPEL